MGDNQHRRDFVLNKDHYFIRQPSEWDTNHFELGQEIRVADGAWDIQNWITVEADSAPDLMDAIADYQVMPRYTELLEIRSALEHILERLNSPIYSSGVNKSIIRREIELALKGETIDK